MVGLLKFCYRDEYSKESKPYRDLTKALRLISDGKDSKLLKMIEHCICRADKVTLTSKSASRCIQQLMPGVNAIIVKGKRSWCQVYFLIYIPSRIIIMR